MTHPVVDLVDRNAVAAADGGAPAAVANVAPVPDAAAAVAAAANVGANVGAAAAQPPAAVPADGLGAALAGGNLLGAAPVVAAAAAAAAVHAAAVGAGGGGGVDPAQVAPPPAPAAGAGDGQGAAPDAAAAPAPVVGADAVAAPVAPPPPPPPAVAAAAAADVAAAVAAAANVGAAAAQPPAAIPADGLGAALAGGNLLGAAPVVAAAAAPAPAAAAGAGGGQGAAPAGGNLLGAAPVVAAVHAAAVGAGGGDGVDPAQVAPPPAPAPAPVVGADAVAAPVAPPPPPPPAAAQHGTFRPVRPASRGLGEAVRGGTLPVAGAPDAAHAAASPPPTAAAQHGTFSSGFLESAAQALSQAVSVMGRALPLVAMGGVLPVPHYTPPRTLPPSAPLTSSRKAVTPITAKGGATAAAVGDYLPLPPTASFKVTSLLHFSTIFATDAANDYVLIPTGSPAIPYLRINRDGSKSLLDKDFAAVPRSKDEKHNQLAQAAWENIKERISALLPRTWLNEKGSPITAKELLDHGGKLKISAEHGLFQSSSVELDLPKSLTLLRKKVAGKMGGAIIIARIEIMQNGDLSFYTARGVKTTLDDYDTNVRKNILAQFLSVAGDARTDTGEDRRAEELSDKIRKKTKALDDVAGSGLKRPPRVAFKDDVAGKKAADTVTLGGDTIAALPLRGYTAAALPAKSKAAVFKTPLPNGFQHFAGIRSGSKKVTHCESYPDDSYGLFDGDLLIARSNELETIFHHSEIQKIAAQKELQLQALEAILSCKQTLQNFNLIIAAKNCLERFVVERDGEGGFKFQLPRVGTKKPSSISITSAGEITLIGKQEDIRSLSKEEPDVSGWPPSQHKKNKQRQSEKVEAVVRLVPAIKDLSNFSEAHIAGCRDESELLKLFFLTYGAKYLSLAKDVDKYDSNKRLIFTFGADQFVEIKLISDVSADPNQIYELTTVGSKVTLDKLIELIKAENPGIHDEKTSQVEALFAARSKEIALERKGKKPLPSAVDRQFKLRAIEKKYRETFPDKKNAIQSIVRNTSNNITTIEQCDEPVELLKHIGKNLFQRIKDADVDYEVKSVGWFPRRKIQNYKFHLEVPFERGKPNRSFDFVISVEENGEISSCDLKWNPESKGELQPTFEKVAEAMNRMGNLIDVKELREKSAQLKLPLSPMMIVPLPKGFEHNPGLFARNKPCKFCAIYSDGAKVLLDEYGDIVASGDKIKDSEQKKIEAQMDLIEKVSTDKSAKIGGVAVPQATQEAKDAKILRALVEKLLCTVPVEEVKKVSARGAATSSKEQGSSYKLPLPKEGWSIEISSKGAVTPKGCTLEQALKALKLRREDLLPSVKEIAASLATGERAGLHEVTTAASRGERAHSGSARDVHGSAFDSGGHEEGDGRVERGRSVPGCARRSDEDERKAVLSVAGGGGDRDSDPTARSPSPSAGRFGSYKRSEWSGHRRTEAYQEERKVAPRAVGGSGGYDSDDDVLTRKSPSPSAGQPLFSAKVASQSHLIEKIVNIAIIALPEGKGIKDLISAVSNVEIVSEALDSSYAKKFQELCSVYEVTSLSAESKSGESSGMSFKEACNRANNSDVIRQLSSMRESDLGSLKRQALKDMSSAELGRSA